jgi:hypothetical protein
MKTFFKIIVTFFIVSKVFSAEFTFEAYGIINIENTVITKNKEYTYFSYKNEGVIITNIDRVGESNCAGGLNITRGRMNVDVLCENISGEYYFYTKYSNFNMDPTNNILKFEIVDGTGPFLELVGQKCTAAYLPIQSDKYLFKGKCDIPDVNFLRMKNLKD